ncbi:hypothetical protein GIB67_020108 [Kingdonia uniflora]|uniref:Uncharacterized protein n=1 Tax=Kingdonia uniflora TaxID=39325 RepID=A0A7J7L2C6_9MAGN|nr:hypothetical protein GIB67_020108 [Kingdonia uniflora]
MCTLCIYCTNRFELVDIVIIHFCSYPCSQKRYVAMNGLTFLQDTNLAKYTGETSQRRADIGNSINVTLILLISMT